jgi:hypothetical protein
VREVKVIILVFLLISLTGCGSTNGGEAPNPTKTVYVPVPDTGYQSGIQEDFESDLQGIRDANCRLAQDLLMQSLDIENQARDLEREAFSLGSNSDLYFNMRDQARNLKDQALNLMIKSNELRQNC